MPKRVGGARAWASCGLLAAALCARGGGAVAAGEPRVGVVVVDYVNTSAAEALEIAEELGRAMEARVQVDAVVEKPGVVSGGCPRDSACIRSTLARLSVEEVLFLIILGVGTETRIEVLSVRSAEAGALPTVERPPVLLQAGEDRANVLARHVPVLLPDRPERPPAPTAGALATAAEEEGASAKADPARGRQFTTGVWIAAGTSVVLLAAAGAGGLYSWRNYKDCIDCDGVRLVNILADGAAIAGAAAAGIAVWLYLRSGESGAERERAVLEIVPGPGTAGLAVSGRF